MTRARTIYLLIMAISLGLVSMPSQAKADQAVVTEDSFTVYHPVAPADLVIDKQGSCGNHRFGITFRYGYERLPDRLHSVRVNGVEIADNVHFAVRPHFEEDTVVMGASLDRCTALGPTRIRLRLQITERSDPDSMRFLDLWIDSAGNISEEAYPPIR